METLSRAAKRTFDQRRPEKHRSHRRLLRLHKFSINVGSRFYFYHHLPFYCGIRLSVRAGVVVRGRELRQSAPQEQREYRVAYFTTTLLVFVQNKLNPRARWW